MKEETFTAKEFLEESWENGNLFPAIILAMIFGFDKSVVEKEKERNNENM